MDRPNIETPKPPARRQGKGEGLLLGPSTISLLLLLRLLLITLPLVPRVQIPLLPLLLALLVPRVQIPLLPLLLLLLPLPQILQAAIAERLPLPFWVVTLAALRFAVVFRVPFPVPFALLIAHPGYLLLCCDFADEDTA
jgi:hypothetical protein